MKVNTILFFSIFTFLINQINSIEYPFNCNSKEICEKCLDNEYSVNGDLYCAKCNDKKGYIGVAGTCIKKENFPKEMLIPNCFSYSPNLEYCAVCDDKDSKFYITESIKCDSLKMKLTTKWIVLICVLGGSFIIGLILIIVLIVKYGNPIQEKSEQEEIIPPPEPEPQPQPIVEEDIVFYICQQYPCSKNGCDGKAVIKSNCNCGYLCLNHANSFYNNNNIQKLKKKKLIHINEYQCQECRVIITLVKKIMPCEECNSPELLENVEGKEICNQCKNKRIKL